MKKLSDLTLNELWELFPVVLNDYNINYPKYYEIEKINILNLLKSDVIRISHIGSTAINIMSKPIIDILLEVKIHDLDIIISTLINDGWILMSKEVTPKVRVSFNKGYTINGYSDKVYHLHLRDNGDHDELYFRDYLIKHNDVSKEYEELKKDLAVKFKHDRDSYTDAKKAFVKAYSHAGKLEFKNKYKP